MTQQKILKRLLEKYGSLYLTLCENSVEQAAVLYTLCCRSFPTEWVPVYAPQFLFFEHEHLLEEEIGKKAVLAALDVLHTQGFVYRAWYDARDKVIVASKGIDENTLPASTRKAICRSPFPSYFVQVRHMYLLQHAKPDFSLLASASFERIRKEYDFTTRDVKDLSPRDQEWFYTLALGDIEAQMTQWGNNSLYISAAFRAAMLRFLRQQTTP